MTETPHSKPHDFVEIVYLDVRLLPFRKMCNKNSESGIDRKRRAELAVEMLIGTNTV